jgi:hypothetical protein
MFPLRVIHDLRPALSWTIYALPIYIEQGSAPAQHQRRFGVRWDDDNDERVLAAVLDVYFRSPEAIWNLYAVGERKGSLTIWGQTFSASDQNAWAAASRGAAILDEWPTTTINTYAEILRTGGLQALRNDDYVHRTFTPEHDDLNWLIKLFALGPSGPRIPF